MYYYAEPTSVAASAPAPAATRPTDGQLTDDGGVVKRVVTAGSGGRPDSGDEVTAHYVGKLQADGTVFDSSVERDSPFSFKLGEGKVIKGWEVALAAMQKGEKAIITLQPDYAYGAAGAPPKIPANAVLEFEIELLDFHPVGFTFGGVVYDRAFDPYDDQPHAVKDERWATDLLGGVLRAVFPEESEKMEYELMLPAEHAPADAKSVRLIGYDLGDGKKDAPTWKEVVVLREWDVVHVYNLVSHGRRMYRSLIYTSKSRFALHGPCSDFSPVHGYEPDDSYGFGFDTYFMSW